MAFCGNVLELVEKYKVLEDYPEFIRWTEIEGQPNVELYIEKDIIPELKKIQPKLFIMTHFGAFMDSTWSKRDLVPEQTHKIQEAVGNKIKVIGANDGLRIKINEYIY